MFGDSLSDYYVTTNVTLVDPFTANIIPKLFKRIDPSYKHYYDLRYYEFIKELYEFKTRYRLGVIRDATQIISINNWYKGAFVSIAYPNIIILATLGDCVESQQGFINEISPILKDNHIQLATDEDRKYLIMFNVPLRQYYPIIDAFFRNDMVMKPLPKVEFKKPQFKQIHYYPKPFTNDMFYKLHQLYISCMRTIARQQFDLDIDKSIKYYFQCRSRELLQEYEECIMKSTNKNEIIDFFTRVKWYNRIVYYRYGRYKTSWDELHFWIRINDVDARIYYILKKYDRNTFDYLMKYTDVFRNYTERVFKLYRLYKRNKKDKKKDISIKQEFPSELQSSSVWEHSNRIFYTGDNDLDYQLHSLLEPTSITDFNC